MSTLLNN